jgi:hypothetical protein
MGVECVGAHHGLVRVSNCVRAALGMGAVEDLGISAVVHEQESPGGLLGLSLAEEHNVDGVGDELSLDVGELEFCVRHVDSSWSRDWLMLNSPKMTASFIRCLVPSSCQYLCDESVTSASRMSYYLWRVPEDRSHKTYHELPSIPGRQANGEQDSIVTPSCSA